MLACGVVLVVVYVLNFLLGRMWRGFVCKSVLSELADCCVFSL